MKLDEIKQLIRETFMEEVVQWNTPEGTPDDVVEALHLILGHLEQRFRNTGGFDAFLDDPSMFVTIEKRGNIWHMAAPAKYPSLMYAEPVKGWSYSMKRGEMKTVRDDKELKYILKNWLTFITGHLSL